LATSSQGPGREIAGNAAILVVATRQLLVHGLIIDPLADAKFAKYGKTGPFSPGKFPFENVAT